MGAIDEVRLWNVARTQTEIQSYMLNPLQGSEQGLISYWNFNENLEDKTANENNGSFENNGSPLRDHPSYINNPAPQIGYVEVNLDKPFEGPQGLWVEYDVSGSANQNTDYFNSRTRRVSTDIKTERNGIIIPQGETSARIYVSALNDAVVEGDENVLITLRPTNFDIFDANSDGNYTSGETGLLGEYYNTKDFTGTKVLSRTDSNVNFSWQKNNPALGVNSDNFSVRWTGLLAPTVTGSYIFYTTSDDGVRLWVNGQQIINNWTDHTPTENTSTTIDLEQGKLYDIKLEYYESSGEATIQLSWLPPRGSKQIIPSTNLLTAPIEYAPSFENNPNFSTNDDSILSEIERNAIGYNYKVGANGTATITIEDNQAYQNGVVLLDQYGQVVSESNPLVVDTNGNAKFQVKLTSQPTSAVTLNLLSGLEILNTASVTIQPSAWDTPQAVTLSGVTGTNNITVSASGYITGNLSFPFTNIPSDKVRITEGSPTDAEAVTPEVTISKLNDVNEGDIQPGQFVINLSAPAPAEGLSIQYQLTGDAKYGTDYTSIPQSALFFDGVDDYVSVSSTGLITGNTPHTLEAWVYLEELPTNRAGLAVLGQYGAGSNHWLIGNDGKIDIGVWNGAQIQRTLEVGKWTHLATVFDGTYLTLYVNGVQFGNSVAATFNFTNNELNLGKAIGNENYFQGQIRDVRVWKTARTATEISDNYNKTLEGDETGLVAYYQANEGSGTILSDSTTNNNQGTLHKGTAWSSYINIAPGETKAVIPIYSLNDDIAEGKELVNIELKQGTGYTLGSSAQTSLNIIDDDKVGIELSDAVVSDYALSFDGVNDYVSASLTGLDTGNTIHTLEAWVYLEKLPTNRAGLAVLGQYDTGAHHWLIQVDGKIDIGVWNGAQIHRTLEVGKWTHLATVFDGTNLTLYVNGVKFGDSVAATFNFTNNDLNLGKAIGNENFFQGQIRDVRVWKTARTATEISNNYNKTLNGNETDLVAYYQANEGSGTILSDATANNNQGTLQNGTAWTKEYTYTGNFDSLVTSEPYPQSGDILQLYDQETGNLVGSIPLTQTQINAGKIKINDLSANATLKAILKESSDAKGSVNLGTVTVKSDGTADVTLLKNENTDAFGVRLSSKPTADVTITFNNIDNTETTFSKSSLTFTPENWDQYQTVIVTGSDDTDDDTDIDGDIKYIVKATAQSEDTTYNNVSTSIAITNLDDDDNVIKTSIETNSGDVSTLVVVDVYFTNITEGFTEGNQIGLGFDLLRLGGTGESLIFYSVDGQDFKYGEDYTVPDADKVYLKETADGVVLTPTDITQLSGTKENKDLDGDGDLDLVVTDGSTTTNYYQFQAVKIAAGQSSATITINTIDDKVDETDEKVKVVLKAGTNYRFNDTPQSNFLAEFTVQDNDTAGVTITTSQGGETSEDGSSLTYSVQLNSQPTHPVKVYIGSNDPSEGKITAPSALSFDGVNDYVSASLTGLDTGNTVHTLEAWVYLKELPTNRAWLAVLGEYGIGAHHWLINADGEMQIGAWAGAQIQPTLEVGKWTHLATVFDGNNLTLYVNGVQFGDSVQASFNFTNNDFKLGLAVGSDNNYFQGQIRDVRVWNTARTATEISNNYHKTLNGDETGLVAYYQANEGSGTILSDATANNNNGTLHNGTAWSNYSEPSEFITHTFNAGNWDTPHTFQVVGINDAIADGDVPYDVITTVTSEDPNYNKQAIAPISLTNTEDTDEAKILITPPGQIVEGRENVFAVKLNSQPVGEIRVIMTPKIDQFRLNNEDIGEPLTLTFNATNWNQTQTVRVTALDDSVVEYFQTSQIEFKVETGYIKDFESKWNNDTPVQAFELGEITGGVERRNLTIDSTDSTTDVDWYKFTLPTQGTAKDFVEIQFANAKGDLNLELYPTNSVLSFDGVNDYASASLTELSTGNTIHTLEAWVYLEKLPTNRAGLAVLGQYDTGAHHWLIQVDGKIDIGVWNGAQIHRTLEVGKWTHLATVFDGTYLTLYVNGVKFGDSVEATFNFTNNDLNLGKAIGNENYFQGQIRDVRVWNTDRTATEISNNYNKTLEGDETGLVAYYQGNEDNGDILVDSSVNKLDGKLINSAIKTSSTTTDNERIELDGLAAGDYLLKVSGKDSTTSNDYKLIIGDADYQYRTAPIEKTDDTTLTALD